MSTLLQEDTVGTTAREYSVHPPPKVYDTGTGQRSTARVSVTVAQQIFVFIK